MTIQILILTPLVFLQALSPCFAETANAPTPVGLPKGHEYFQLRDGLDNCRVKFETTKTGRIAFFGGSITFNPGWRDGLMTYFQKKFPETKFDFVAAGIPSLGSVPHAFRLERDVLSLGPVDLLFVEAAVNDTENGTTPLEMLRAMEGIVRHARATNPLTDMIEMHFVDPAHLQDFHHGRIPESVAQHEKVAAHYGNVSLNLSEEVADRIDAGEFTWAHDFRSVHPSPFGQQLYLTSMERMLDAAFKQPLTAAKPHAMPPPLDAFNYANGHFGKLADAKLIKGFTLVTDWTPEIPRHTRPGYVHVPALTATSAGSEFEFNFDGNAAGLMIAAGPEAGIIEVTCDDGPAKKIDTFTSWSRSLYLPWAVMLADGLASGHHRIHIKLLDEHNARSTGTALHVFNLLEN